MVFHVLNCGVASMQLFEKPADFQAFELVLRETRDESPIRICADCLMPNHWHLLLLAGAEWRNGGAHAAIDHHSTPRRST